MEDKNKVEEPKPEVQKHELDFDQIEKDLNKKDKNDDKVSIMKETYGLSKDAKVLME